jgi:FRG domain
MATLDFGEQLAAPGPMKKEKIMRLDIEPHTSAIKLTDLSEAIQAAKEIIGEFNHDTPLWRGHGDADWPLRAQVFRRDQGHPEAPLYDEQALIGHFMSRAETRTDRRCPSPNDYFGWLFLAQHYGLPTRLLDWTENPLVALYFGVVDKQQEDKDGCIWALWPEGLNACFGSGAGFVQIRDPKVVEIARCAFDSRAKCDQVIVAIDGREIDPRMLAQMSRFTLHPHHAAMEVLPASEPWLRRYVIPREEKAKIRAQLAALGIRRSNLFPDLSSLAAELKEVRW